MAGSPAIHRNKGFALPEKGELDNKCSKNKDFALTRSCDPWLKLPEQESLIPFADVRERL